MLKISIIGYSGSSKTTFANNLKDIINIPFYHLDMIWHRPDKTTLSKLRNAKRTKITKKR